MKQRKSSQKKGYFTSSAAMENKGRHSRINILKLARNDVNIINSQRFFSHEWPESSFYETSTTMFTTIKRSGRGKMD